MSTNSKPVSSRPSAARSASSAYANALTATIDGYSAGRASADNSGRDFDTNSRGSSLGREPCTGTVTSARSGHGPAGLSNFAARSAVASANDLEDLLSMVHDTTGNALPASAPSSRPLAGHRPSLATVASVGSIISDDGRCRHVYVGCGPTTADNQAASSASRSASSAQPSAAAGTVGSSNAHQRICSSLRCTSCDFSVLRWDGYAWASDVEYMFFRNHVPDRRKLEAKIRRQAGAAAYCCQCSWVTVLPLQARVPSASSSGSSTQPCSFLIRKSGAATPTSGRDLERELSRGGASIEAGGLGWSCWTCGGGHQR